MLKRIQEAIVNGEPATRDDLVENLEDEFTVAPNYSAYANVKVTGHIDEMQTQPVTHLKFTPLIDDGIVIAQPAAKGEKGAEEFVRGETRRTGRVNLRAALNGFGVTFPEARSLRLPVKPEKVDVNGSPRTILLIEVQTPETKARVIRPRKPKAEEAKKDQPKDPGAAAPGCQTPPQDEQTQP